MAYWLAAGMAAPAYAMQVPQPGEHGRSGPGTPVYVTPVHVIAGGGMPGWQITLITFAGTIVRVARYHQPGFRAVPKTTSVRRAVMLSQRSRASTLRRTAVRCWGLSASAVPR